MSVTNYLTMNGMIVHENRDGVQRDYVPDTLGSTAALVDDTQTITDRWEYWPYGEASQRTGASPTPFTFVGMLGYYRDLIDKMVYVRARNLRSDLARWLTTDPLWPSEAAYIYASVSPTALADPFGTSPCQIQPPSDEQEGISSCYNTESGFKNCCTACGKCFTKAQECSNGVAAFPGSGFKCGDKIRCCLVSDKSKCWDLEITDTGGGREGRIIDFGCCFAREKGIMPSPGLVKLVCWKTGSSPINRKCKKHEDCGSDRGKFCPSKKKKEKQEAV